MKRLVIRPEGWPCTLAECPPGFFLYHDHLCLKTEYAADGPYNEGGEIFWGGTDSKQECNALVVQPVEPVWEEYEP